MNKSDNFSATCNFPSDLSDHVELAVDYCQEKIECSSPEFYGFLYGWIGTICQSSVFLVGVVGNLVVVVTVRGTKSLHTTTNCYLVSLAISDLITLVSSVPQVWFLRESRGNAIRNV